MSNIIETRITLDRTTCTCICTFILRKVLISLLKPAVSNTGASTDGTIYNRAGWATAVILNTINDNNKPTLYPIWERGGDSGMEWGRETEGGREKERCEAKLLA